MDLVKCYVKWTDREIYEYTNVPKFGPNGEKVPENGTVTTCSCSDNSGRGGGGGGSKKIIDTRMF